MSYIISIDVGIRNLGFVVYDTTTQNVVEWKRVDICKEGKYFPYKNVQYALDFMNEHANYFANCQLLLVERQMRVNMRILEAVFQSQMYDRCVVVQAQSVKMHFSIACRNYKQNKRRAVEWLTFHWNTFAGKYVLNINAWQQTWLCSNKQDDLADCMIMLLYYLNTYSDSVKKQ